MGWQFLEVWPCWGSCSLLGGLGCHLGWAFGFQMLKLAQCLFLPAAFGLGAFGFNAISTDAALRSENVLITVVSHGRDPRTYRKTYRPPAWLPGSNRV